MWLSKSAFCFCLLIGLTLAQNSETGSRRLRFRRPRPNLANIENPEGDEVGLPIPLRRKPAGQRRPDTAALLATAALGDDDEDLRAAVRGGQSLQNTDALQTLLATAAAEEPFEPEPIIEEEPEQFLVIEEEEPEIVTQAPSRTEAPRRRRPPNVPRQGQRQPRPRLESGEDEEAKGQRIPNKPKEDPVKTTENYSYSNPDGSFTFGYIAEDGSFREETRGVDCITRGKYGYIDPDGRKREFTYVSGLPCDVGAEGEEQDVVGENSIQDPIDPSERFRTAPAVQLDDAEIPDSARPRPQRPNVAAVPDQSRVRARPRPTQARPLNARPSSALDNLLSVAGGEESEDFVAPTRAPVRRPPPRPASPAPTRAPASAFDFDAEVDNFNLKNKPALTFSPVEEPKTSDQPRPVGPNFSSELVFDPATGTFKTELRQNIGGQDEIRIVQDAQPQGVAQPVQAFSPTPVTTTAAPSPSPFSVFASPTPTARPASPTPTARPASPIQSAAPVTFAPLNFPDPVPSPQPSSPVPTASPTTPRPPPASPSTLAPTTPASVFSPQPVTSQPGNSFFFQPFQTIGTPRPVAPGQPATPTGAPFTLTPSVTPTPAPTRPQAVPQTPAGTFAQPTTFGSPTPQPQAGPTPTIQFGFQPIQQQAPAAPVTPNSLPGPAAPAPAAPSSNPRPFTAFATGLPPQLSGSPAQQFAQRPQQQPQQFFQLGAQQPTQFQGLPPRPVAPQQQPQQFFQLGPQQPSQPQALPPRPGAPQQFGLAPQQFPQGGARFTPFGRPPAQPAQPGQSSPFTVFNPSSFIRQN